jgi:hypothetical protein
MKDTDREGFVAAERIAREAGAPLLDAVKSYAAAMKALAGTGGLLEAAKEYATRHASQIKPMSVAEAVAAFVANKRATPGLDARYVANVENAANRFAEAFKQQLAALGAEDVQRWIRAKRDGKALGWKRQNDLRSLIVEIAKFAKKKGALPPGDLELATLKHLRNAELKSASFPLTQWRRFSLPPLRPEKRRRFSITPLALLPGYDRSTKRFRSTGRTFISPAVTSVFAPMPQRRAPNAMFQLPTIFALGSRRTPRRAGCLYGKCRRARPLLRREDSRREDSKRRAAPFIRNVSRRDYSRPCRAYHTKWATRRP